ncbi:MAG TPA: hypothetical protein VGE52_19615, partial [Pirellulales bacterium]
GAVTIPDVLSMQRAGVSEDLIINHVRANSMATALTSNDLIALQQQGVSNNIIAAMQSSPPRSEPVGERPVVIRETPVVVDRYYDPYWGPHYHYRRRPPPCHGPHVGVGVVF